MIRFGIHIPNFGPFGEPAAVVDLAQAAERAGWDGLFIWDHIRWENDADPMVDPWIALAAAAQATDRLRLGAMITPLARRRPWKLARETVSLDRLSSGRLIFGAGLGWGKEIEFADFGEETDDRQRAGMLDEGLDVMTGLWSGESFSFSGEHFMARDVTFLPRPVQIPRIPIWIAGLWPNPRPFRRAARWDGVVPERRAGGTVSAAEVAEIRTFVRDEGAGDRPFDIAVGGYSDRDRGYEDQFGEYERNGLTWWWERLDPDRQLSTDETFALVAAGPPK
jgi:alkanesulfonate monooxygenase SsuD/methylene tetrahydromethanopterin reductase-like flavin-dependent oxidoreductase (luciferase family)